MKKLISIALIFALCFTLAACTGGSKKNAIVGEWKAFDFDATATFNKDGSCKIKFDTILNYFDLDADATWRYDKESGCYYISTATAMNATIETVSDIEYFTLPLIPTRDIVFYRAEDYEKAIQITIEKQKNEIAKIKEGKTKLQLNETYDFGNDISVKFTDICLDEDNRLLLKTSVKNNSTEKIGESNISLSGGLIYYPCGGDIREPWSPRFNLPAGFISAGSENDFSHIILDCDQSVMKALDILGEFTGIFYITIDSTEYYIDLGEYVTKDISAS